MNKADRKLSELKIHLASAVLAAVFVLAVSSASGAELWIGRATADITPDQPVPLTGYTTMRVSKSIHSRCKANVLAIEAREGEKVVGRAIFVACDLCVIRPGIQEGFRQCLAKRLPEFDVNKLFLAATHTHAAPVLLQDRYQSYGDAMQPKDYVEFMNGRIADAVVKAWNQRQPGEVAWGLGHAVVACNRRAAFADGHAAMYGKTDTPEFRNIEGYEDHGVHFVFFFDKKKQLIAAMVTVACPSQSVRGSSLSADFWHDVREYVQKRHGKQVCVLGFCAPAGDQSPHPLLGKKGEARMDRFRKLTRTQELGRRIAASLDDVLEVVKQDIRADVPFVHRIERFDIPDRRVTEAEYARCKAFCDKLDAKPKMVGSDWWQRHFQGYVLKRYEAQEKGHNVYPVEMHVIRLGDVAIATNPFELYTDYGIQIQARSKAQETILIQLASPLDFGYYVPTPKAVAGGGYSAEVTQSLVGPKGAQVLVERTVKDINALFEKK